MDQSLAFTSAIPFAVWVIDEHVVKDIAQRRPKAFGFISVLSIITIQNAFVSTVSYNVSLDLVVCSIGIKLLFLKKDNI